MSTPYGLRCRYGLDKPLYQQYLIWIAGVMQGDFGVSFDWDKPVSELIWSRLGLTMLVTLATLIFTYVVAIPIGIYSATRQYSLFDYGFTFTGFIGLATPNFLLALVLMFVFYRLFGLSIGGLFSPHMIGAPWSLARVFDLISHLWIPVIVIGTAGTAGLMRVMRGCLLDEIRKQYVVTARSKGVGEIRLLFKYPVRISLFPIVSTIGWLLPEIISGSAITAVVLSCAGYIRRPASATRSGSSGAAPSTGCGGCSPPTATRSRLRTGAWCSCSAPTVWAVTCSRASCTARASRSPSACSGCASRW